MENITDRLRNPPPQGRNFFSWQRPPSATANNRSQTHRDTFHVRKRHPAVGWLSFDTGAGAPFHSFGGMCRPGDRRGVDTTTLMLLSRNDAETVRPTLNERLELQPCQRLLNL